MLVSYFQFQQHCENSIEYSFIVSDIEKCSGDHSSHFNIPLSIVSTVHTKGQISQKLNDSRIIVVVLGLPQDMRASLSCSYPLGFNNIFLHESNLYFGTLLSNVFKVSCNIKGTSTKASAVQMATCLNTFDKTFIS